jgi:hypothetical protein
MIDKTKVEEVHIVSLNYNENHILLLHFVHVGATSTVEKGEGAMGPHVIQNTSEKKCSHPCDGTYLLVDCDNWTKWAIGPWSRLQSYGPSNNAGLVFIQTSNDLRKQ